MVGFGWLGAPSGGTTNCFAPALGWASSWFRRPTPKEINQQLIDQLTDRVDRYELQIRQAESYERDWNLQLAEKRRELQRTKGTPTAYDMRQVRSLMLQLDQNNRRLIDLCNKRDKTSAMLYEAKNHVDTLDEIGEQRLLNSNLAKVMGFFSPEVVAETLVESEANSRQMSTIQNVVSAHSDHHQVDNTSLDAKVSQWFEQLADEQLADLPLAPGRHTLGKQAVVAPPSYGDKDHHHVVIGTAHEEGLVWERDHP